MARLSAQEIDARLQLVDEAQTDDFAELVRIAGLDPRRDLRFADWAGVDFSGADLRGFDFTGARLHDCDFTGARIMGARFDQAELGIVDHIATPWRRENPNAPGVISKLANLRDAADWDEFVRGWRRGKNAARSDTHLRVGAIFQDAPFAPPMVVVPAGTYRMGSTLQEINHLREEYGEPFMNEGPQHRVTVPEPFGVSIYPVTFKEWDIAQADRAWRRATRLRPRRPYDGGLGRGNRPVVNVSWEDAQGYVKWLSAKSGKQCRLLSEAEWEYVARAGTTTRYAFGNTVSRSQAQFFDGDWIVPRSTAEVGSFSPNAWGLYDTHGNVWEWVEDCLNENYKKKREYLRVSGKAWATGNCADRVLRGGSWSDGPEFLRSATRAGLKRKNRSLSSGFRLARTLTL